MGRPVPWRYTRLRGRADGWATVPDPKRPDLPESVLISQKLKGRARLETEAHEFLHVAFPALSEDAVTHAARDLARILHGLGYRLQ